MRMTLSTIPYALAVDDEPFILMDITGILEDAGFRTYEASITVAFWSLNVRGGRPLDALVAITTMR
jgi:hypothetical protein